MPAAVPASAPAAARATGRHEAGPRELNRRVLLTGGLAAGGLAGFALAAPADAAADPSAGPVVYGPSPAAGSDSDDGPALQAALYALSGGGTVLLPPGTYHLRTLVYVPTGVDLRGSGGGYAGAATVLRCATADAGLHVWGGGGITGNFIVDGATVATTPFTRGYEGSAVGRTFAALSVRNSAGDGVSCLGSQNDAWYQLTVEKSARDGLVLDQGYGGALFSKCEVSRGGRFNLRIDNQVVGGPYSSPSDNVFHQCIFEYNEASTQSIAYLHGGWANKFDHVSFYASQPTVGPVVEVSGGAAELVFEDVTIQSTGNVVGGIGLRVDWGCGVTLAGTAHFQNLDSAIYLRRTAGAPTTDPYVNVLGTPLYYYCTTRVDADPAALPDGRTAGDYVSRLQVQHLESRLRRADDVAYVSRVEGDRFYAVAETADGRRSWGSGDAAGDVALGRRSVGVLGVDAGDLFATGYGSAADRPDPTPSAAGALRLNVDAQRLEVSDGSEWHAPAEHAATFTTSGSFVVPAGVTMLRCHAIGAGGGGGGGGTIGATSRATSCFGGAGGGAGMVLESLVPVTPGETLDVAIGGGGTGGGGGGAGSGSTGNAGRAGQAGGTSALRRSGVALVQAPGGGGGTGGPAATATAAVAPTSGGAFGCADTSLVVAPGTGSFAGRGVLPAPGGVCGGASGAPASTTRGGTAGTPPAAPGLRGAVGTAASATKNGQAGAAPQVAGCGGNGGGAGARGGSGGAGGAGAGGRIDLWWVR